MVYDCYPHITPALPDNITFIHSEELLNMYPDLAPREREAKAAEKFGAIFIIGIGGQLADGKKHDGRAPDYDDWSSVNSDGFSGLNGDIILWNEVLGCTFELSSMGIRVDKDCIDNGAPLDRETADAVATGMKKWAIEMGATHYTHWFHPLTEGTAEKHDGKGGMVEEFSGKLLIQQEPDASSFPSSGIRNTFEARGYSAWDPSSPAFIVGDTLCIPTVFIAYTGESLDYKAPLLKALEAVNKAAVDVCHYFNPDVKKVYAYLGWEQEYFLVDEGLYAARPDLLLTGRTLMGHESSKNQQLEDHYFGAIPTRVMEFMKDLEIEASNWVSLSRLATTKSPQISSSWLLSSKNVTWPTTTTY